MFISIIYFITTCSGNMGGGVMEIMTVPSFSGHL